MWDKFAEVLKPYLNSISGVPAGNWWLGSESNAGNALATTANCNGFTNAGSSVYGNFGNAIRTRLIPAGWLLQIRKPVPIFIRSFVLLVRD